MLTTKPSTEHGTRAASQRTARPATEHIANRIFGPPTKLTIQPIARPTTRILLDLLLDLLMGPF